MMKQRRATSIDRIIGKNIRLRRQQQRISQMDLGDALGVSFQQVQKYEKGSNRLSISRFLEIAKILDIQPELLWQEADASIAPKDLRVPKRVSKPS